MDGEAVEKNIENKITNELFVVPLPVCDEVFFSYSLSQTSMV